MNVRACVLYVFGHGPSIRQAAESRSAIWIGVVLVLLTAIARSYDQTVIFQAPLRWLFGPLAFSLVSGTWLYAVAYGLFARMWMTGEGVARPPFWSGWRSFMGLFWLTAPIAWLYAIPVERFLDPVAAARANVGLLAVVSFWRVVLMARVLQHLTRTRWRDTLAWILLPASVEVLLVFFFSGHFARSLMASMGGLRNSPAEEVLIHAMAAATNGALCVAPLALLLSLQSVKPPPVPLPVIRPDRPPWPWLAAAAVGWIGIAIGPQIELKQTAEVDRLMRGGEYRKALDFLGARQRGDFAPAQVLPPKPYEREIFKHLPSCLAAVQPSDPPWVRAFLVQRIDEMVVHAEPRGRHPPAAPEAAEQRRIGAFRRWVDNHGLDAAAKLRQLIDGLDRIPEGRSWLAAHPRFIQDLKQITEDESALIESSGDRLSWEALRRRLSQPLPSPE